MDDLNNLADINEPQGINNIEWHGTFSKMISSMKFVGIFNIIYGALNCLTIIGAIFGVPMIIMGLRLREAADEFQIFKTTSSNHALRKGFELQTTYFFIQKIFLIIGLVGMVLGIIAFIAILVLGVSTYNNEFRSL